MSLEKKSVNALQFAFSANWKYHPKMPVKKLPQTIDDLCDVKFGVSGSTDYLKRFYRPKPIKKWVRKTVHIQMSQAERVVKKFGGAVALAKCLELIGHPKSVSTIYRWMYPVENQGTGGTIPPHAWEGIMAAAEVEGVILVASDFDPRVIDISGRIPVRNENYKEEK